MDPHEVVRHLLYTPERMILAELSDYPAHPHIDLLPGFQRAGPWRRRHSPVQVTSSGSPPPRANPPYGQWAAA